MMLTISPQLTAKIDELERLAPSREDAWQISRQQGEIQAGIALSLKAKVIVEVGTSYGFSGLWWLAALEATDGVLHTIDQSQKKYDASRENFSQAGVLKRVHSHLGDALAVLPTMPNHIDIAFIDADKPNTQAYFDILWPKVRVGGAVLTDNVLSHATQMSEFVAALRQRTDAHSVTIPTRSGLEWTLKLA